MKPRKLNTDMPAMDKRSGKRRQGRGNCGKLERQEKDLGENGKRETRKTDSIRLLLRKYEEKSTKNRLKQTIT